MGTGRHAQEARRPQLDAYVERLLSERGQGARLLHLDAIAARVVGGTPVRLLCHCYPKRCHADEIAKLVAERADAMLVARRGKRRR